MGKVVGGILGIIKNKVGGVVFSTWKGINTARTRVIPANPKSVAQTRVRGSFAVLNTIGKSILTTFINTYWDTLVKGKPTSGWATFLGVNQKAVQALQDYENIKLATGALEPVKSATFLLDVGSNQIEFEWSKAVVSDGQTTDELFLHVYVPERNFVYIQAAPLTRNDEIGEVAIPDLAGVTGDTYAYITMKNASELYSTTQGAIPTP